jgi:hypothetical protein
VQILDEQAWIFRRHRLAGDPAFKAPTGACQARPSGIRPGMGELMWMRNIGALPFAGSRIAGSRHGNRPTEKRPMKTTPDTLELSGSQWAIKLPDGRVIPTGTDKERTERDAEWENGHSHGHSGCCAVVRDAYQTPWRPTGAPAPIVAPCAEAAIAQAAQVAALQAQVDRLVDLLHYRQLAAEQAKAELLPGATHGSARRTPVLRLLRPARSQARSRR